MMKRLLVVYNPRSSKFVDTDREVLARLRSLNGWMVGKFEVQATDVDKNALALSKVVMDGDLVLAAGGDATATIAMNGVMLSKARGLRFAALNFGNFNDISSSFRTHSLEEILEGKSQKVWPLECLVNGEHFRWGMCYFTIGLFAEACAVFDEKEVRKELQRSRGKLIYSLWQLARWYTKNRQRDFLKEFELASEGRAVEKYVGMSDYVAVNGRRMARVMKGGEWFLQEKGFLSVTDDLRRFRGLFRVMFRSVLSRVPGSEVTKDELFFAKATKLMVQAEGEYKMLEKVHKIEIRKALRPIEVILK